MAFDLEWYATPSPTPLEPAGDRAGVEVGYEQHGVVHGAIDVLGEAAIEFTEVPAHRWHRWVTSGDVSSRPRAAGAPGGRRPHRSASALRIPGREHQRPRAHLPRLEPASAPPDTRQRRRNQTGGTAQTGGDLLHGLAELVAEQPRVVRVLGIGAHRARRARPRRRRRGCASGRHAHPAGSPRPPRPPTSARCRGTSR